MSEVIEVANTNQNQIVAADPYKNDLDRGKLCRDLLRLPTICLVLIIFVAFIIRTHFFIGFAGGDPQDDGIYINIAKGILQNGFYDHNIQKNMILHNPIINPIYMFPARLLMTYATACSFILFGVSDYSAALFPLICSLLSIYIIYKIGWLLFNYRVGLFAGFFLAIMPLDIIFSTRVTPDVPIAFFMSLGVYLFLKGMEQKKSWCFYFAGIAAGIGYLTKETAMIIVACMGLWTIVSIIKDKKFSAKPFLVLLGVTTILVLEGIYYELLTDFYFLRFQLIPKILKIKYAEEYRYLVFNLKWLIIKYQPNSILTYLETLLNKTNRGSEANLNFLGVFYYPILISLIWIVLKRINKGWIIVTWLILLYSYLEFGFVGVTFTANPVLVTYELIQKYTRYLTIISAPACLLLALWLVYQSGRYRYIITGIIICILLNASYEQVSTVKRFYKSHTNDLFETARFLKTQKQRKIYADLWVRDMLFYYSGFKMNTPVIDIGEITKNSNSPRLKDSYVVLGGSRGSGLTADYFEKDYRNVLKHIPENWVVLKTIPGVRDSFRKRDLIIYYIPS